MEQTIIPSQSAGQLVSQVPKPNYRLVFLIIILIILTGILGYQLGKDTKPETPIVAQPIITKSPTPTAIPTIDQTADWKKYRNENYGLEFKYPREYLLDETLNEIKVNAPLSKCNPALVFNIQEYNELREIYISIKKRPGSLAEVLLEEGGKEYGWLETDFNRRKAYSVSSGGEVITPLERLLIDKGQKEVLDVYVYVFGSDDGGKCNPKLAFTKANNTKKLILSTFKFLP